jgi:hypothetical protein
MEIKEAESEVSWELHKSVFANDLRRLNQLLKSEKYKKDDIDRKVNVLIKCIGMQWTYLYELNST